MIRVNPAACALFGYPVAEMLGKNLGILMTQDMAAQHDGFMRHHLETGENRIIGIGRELEGKRQDGSTFPLHLSIGRAEIDEQPVFVGIMHNLTRRKHSEMALEQSQRMEAIGRLTGGVAHDFNNLLTVITGNLELLDDKLTADTERELLRDALSAAELGAELTGRLLAFARRGLLTPNLLDANKIVTRVVGLLQHTIGPRVEIKTALAPDVWAVCADQTQLQTALINLAANALDAMPDGGTLVFETQNVTIDDTYIAQEIDIKTGHYLRISVTDTGQGMDPDIVRHVFEPFYTTKPVGKGTGLGLSMVYGFVKQSGGHSTLYSEIGQGTTVGLYFPANIDPAANPEIAPLAKGKHLPQGRGQVVLVVEDDPKVRRLSVARIEALGYKVLAAANAAKALEVMAGSTPIDLVFTDLVMPGDMAGYGLAQHVRATYPQTRILLTSGYAEDVVQANALVDSGFELLRKPYRQADLAALLARIFATQ